MIRLGWLTEQGCLLWDQVAAGERHSAELEGQLREKEEAFQRLLLDKDAEVSKADVDRLILYTHA